MQSFDGGMSASQRRRNPKSAIARWKARELERPADRWGRLAVTGYRSREWCSPALVEERALLRPGSGCWWMYRDEAVPSSRQVQRRQMRAWQPAGQLLLPRSGRYILFPSAFNRLALRNNNKTRLLGLMLPLRVKSGTEAKDRPYLCALNAAARSDDYFSQARVRYRPHLSRKPFSVIWGT